MLRFASLASGSRGNSLVVECDGTRVLLDCGLSAAETTRRLGRLDLAPSSLAAIFVTHEHDDHVSGVFAFAAAHGLPVCLTHGTFAAIEAAGKVVDGVAIRIVCDGATADVNGLAVQPFTVPHDAREPVQYVFSDGAHRLGVLSDLGNPTAHVAAQLTGCDALVLECNHDTAMLAGGRYPGWLKERIGGAFGHLSNEQAARILGGLDHNQLSHVVAAHLSTSNNTPVHAQSALAGVLGCEPRWIAVADQRLGLGWRDVHAARSTVKACSVRGETSPHPP